MERPHAIVTGFQFREMLIRQQWILAQSQYYGVDPAYGVVQAAHQHAIITYAVRVSQVFYDVLVLSHHGI
jgi:hypothetical protein